MQKLFDSTGDRTRDLHRMRMSRADALTITTRPLTSRVTFLPFSAAVIKEFKMELEFSNISIYALTKNYTHIKTLNAEFPDKYKIGSIKIFLYFLQIINFWIH